METNKNLKYKVDSVNNLILQWESFKRISDLKNQNRNEVGIYVWGFTVNNIFVPYYVGIAYCLSFRLYEHINSIIGGRYTIFHKNSLADFNFFKNHNIQEDKSKGKIYIPEWPYGYNFFLENRKEFQTHIDFMIEAFTYTYAIVDRDQISGQDLKDIEKICINQLGKENLVNTRAGYSDKFSLNHSGNSTIVEKMKVRTGCSL